MACFETRRRFHCLFLYQGKIETDRLAGKKYSCKERVVATTSIGQEGLDFHNYCRVIMHWNLPSNPIDLEQREGRINRFKCLAIRQNVADKYGKAGRTSGVFIQC